MDQYTFDIFARLGMALGMGIGITFLFLYVPFKAAQIILEMISELSAILGKKLFEKMTKGKRKNIRASVISVRDWNTVESNRRFRMNQWIRGYEAAMAGETLDNYLAVEDSGTDFERISRTAFVDGYRYYNLLDVKYRDHREQLIYDPQERHQQSVDAAMRLISK